VGIHTRVSITDLLKRTSGQFSVASVLGGVGVASASGAADAVFGAAEPDGDKVMKGVQPVNASRQAKVTGAGYFIVVSPVSI
jgi:hypothetical protein